MLPSPDGSRGGTLVFSSRRLGPAADGPELVARHQLYNQRLFDAALIAADEARLTPAVADLADLIAARAYLERFRESAASADLTNARERLRGVNPQRFDPIERTEFIVGLSEALFFEGSYGAAADVFEAVVNNGTALPADSRERVLDWWASALDRDAWQSPELPRERSYQRILAVCATSTSRRSAAAACWLAARPHAREGDRRRVGAGGGAGPPGAWRRGASGFAPLDRLMLTAIVPERARMLSSRGRRKLEWDKSGA
jgi:hypothetical protein